MATIVNYRDLLLQAAPSRWEGSGAPGTVDWNDIGGIGKPDDFADVTVTVVQGGLVITGGGITLSGGGAIKGGQTDYNTGTGFFLGYSGGTYKFSIGNGTTKAMLWDGTDFEIRGKIRGTSDLEISGGAYIDGLKTAVNYSGGQAAIVSNDSLDSTRAFIGVADGVGQATVSYQLDAAGVGGYLGNVTGEVGAWIDGKLKWGGYTYAEPDGSSDVMKADGTWGAAGGTGAITASGYTMATEKLLGRGTAATGAVEEITVGAGLNLNGTTLEVSATNPTLQSIIVACSDETTLLTTGLKVTFRMPYSFTLSAVRGSLTEAATGATKFAFNVLETGATIFTTKPTFDASEKTTFTASVPCVISDIDLVEDVEMTIVVDAIGSTLAGKGLKVYLIGAVNPSVSPIGETGLVAWYRKGVGQVDASGTGVCSTWLDQSGLDHHLEQATLANRPAIQADGSVIFNGDFMQALFTLTQPVTVYLRMKAVTSIASQVFMDGGQDSKMYFQQTTPPSYEIGIWAGVYLTNLDLGTNVKGTVSAVYNGASSVLQVNSNTPATGNVGTATPIGGITLGTGGNGNLSNSSHLQVWEVLVYNVAHDATARQERIDYLATV